VISYLVARQHSPDTLPDKQTNKQKAGPTKGCVAMDVAVDVDICMCGCRLHFGPRLDLFVCRSAVGAAFIVVFSFQCPSLWQAKILPQRRALILLCCSIARPTLVQLSTDK